MRYRLVIEVDDEIPLDEMLNEYDWIFISATSDEGNPDYPEEIDDLEVQVLSIVRGDFFE